MPGLMTGIECPPTTEAIFLCLSFICVLGIEKLPRTNISGSANILHQHLSSVNKPTEGRGRIVNVDKIICLLNLLYSYYNTNL